MSYQKVNGYAITPYDMQGHNYYAIRDGVLGCLIYNDKSIPLILATEEYAIQLAKVIPKCSELKNFKLEAEKE